ncbi:MAG: LuxR C-terminal-related transcriptional regulator [Solirubrobacteraceae bacterium]
MSADRATPDDDRDVRALERLLVELLALEREVVEREYMRRADALERVREATRQLGEVGSPEGILERAAPALGASSQFDRVLISDVVDRRARPHAIWSRDDQEQARAALQELRGAPIRLEYPLIEEEVARHQKVKIVSLATAAPRMSPALVQALGCASYVVAALTVGGTTMGLLHADATSSGRPLDTVDAEVVAGYAEALAGVLERAVLRERLQVHRRQLQSAVGWMSGRLDELSTQSIEHMSGADAGLGAVYALTPRELDVLRLLARGKTNLEIANTLVVREGTVKYHVKNILSKLGAASRADAVARYARATSSTP